MFKSIVCAIGRGSRARMEKLIEASHQMLAPNGNLYLVHAVEGLPSSSVRSPDGWAVGVIADTENRLTELLHEAGQQAFIRVRAGNPSDVIVSVEKTSVRTSSSSALIAMTCSNTYLVRSSIT